MTKKANDLEEEVKEHDICDSAHEMKEKLEHFQESVITYVKENPGKALGISVVAGALLAQLFRSK